MERRSLWKLVLGLVLIVIGLALLLNNLGIVPGLWRFIAGLWPIALVAMGLAVLLGWQRGITLPWQASKSTPINEPLADVRTTTLELSGHVGELEIEAGGASSRDLLSGKVPANSRLQVENSGSSALIWLEQKGLGRLPFISPKDAWELRLNPSVGWTLHLNAGLGEAEIDLTDLRVQELQLGGPSGEVKVKLPRRGQCVVIAAGHIDDLTLRVPDGVLARIYPPAGGTSRIDTVRFPLRDDAYESPGFGAAVDWIEIRLDGAAISNLRVL